MRLLFLSNGHGEDLIGSRLARELRRLLPAAGLSAFPLVGRGGAYEAAGITTLGSRRELPSGGLTLHTFGNLAADVRAGLLRTTGGQLRDLRRLEADAVIVTGDLWALSLSLLTGVRAERRYVLQPLVSLARPGPLTSPNRLFMERITLPERILQRRFTARVWTRDAATAARLRDAGVTQAAFSGSFLEPVTAPAAPEAVPGRPDVLLLPGSRSWARESLAVMLGVVPHLPGVRFRVAWAGGPLPEPSGWELVPGTPALLHRNGSRVELHAAAAFRDLLAEADAVFGTSGTALEEAAASGRPCLSFPLPGRHSAAFLRNQERILEGALHAGSAREPVRLAARLHSLLTDPALRANAARTGRRLAAEAGGIPRIASELAALLS